MKLAGVLGTFFSLLFILIVVVLGFLQPTYNPVEHTISWLIFGKYGFVQQINFVFISLAIMSVGYGLGMSLYGKFLNRVTLTFGVMALGMLSLIVFPADNGIVGTWANFDEFTFSGKVHYVLMLVVLLIAPIIILFTTQAMKKHFFWKKMLKYSYFVLFSSFILGAFWFILVGMGYLLVYRGLCQKVILFNVVLWMAVVGFNLWSFEERKQ